MRASYFVGRVGGLAAALGVGAAIFSGAGTAGADSSDPTAQGSRASAGDHPSSSHREAVRGAGAERSAPNTSRLGRPAQTSAPVAAAATRVASVSSVIDGATTLTSRRITDGPPTPTNSPLPSGLLAASRRQPSGAASLAADEEPVQSPLERAASEEALTVLQERAVTETTVGAITVRSVVALAEGNVIGVYQATTTHADSTLSYSSISGSNGSKVRIDGAPGAFTMLPYANWLDPNGTKGTQQVLIGIRETTAFDAKLFNVPFVGLVARPVINQLQDTPFISDLLAPMIGVHVVVPIDVNIAELAPDNTPVAFTYDVPSFDGVKISTNFFPASGLVAGSTAPTAVIAPGFGFPGVTDPYAVYALKDEVPGIGTLRKAGYNVVTYDPRGRFDSEGEVHMANPKYEGKDVSSLISWIASRTPASLDATEDPKVGLLGGSYGAALQFAAANDHRIDAMVPVDGWDTLLESFYPNNTFRTGYGALTVLSLVTTGSRVYTPLYWAFGSGMLLNWLGPWSRSLINATNPQLGELTAPTLIIRGASDVLFPLQQGTASAQAILESGKAPVKMLWFCGGHGRGETCGDDQANIMNTFSLVWLDQYVKGANTLADLIPNFSWFDQKGDLNTSALMPFQDGFNDLPDVVAKDRGGLLGIVPVLGGSGKPLTFVNGSEARNAINVAIPTDKLLAGTQVVGAPTVSFTYRGLGTSGAVFAQVVDKTTGEVLGSVVAPVPVQLDGFKHTVSIDIGEISYTAGAGDSLEVQITSSALAFLNASVGLINISDVIVTLPNRSAVAP